MRTARTDYDWEKYLLRELIAAWERSLNHSFEQTYSTKDKIERDAKIAYRSLLKEQELPQDDLHPASILCAIDRYLGKLSVFSDGAILTDKYYILPQPEGWQSNTSKSHFRHRNHWLRSHKIFPRRLEGLEVCLKRLGSSQDQGLEVSKPIRIWATGFEDDVEPDWIQPPPYSCEKLTDSEQRVESVRRIFQRCQEFKVDILILPELTVDQVVLDCLQEWLQDKNHEHELKLVVAGSFHVTVEGERKNRSVVLDRFGKEVMTQDKLLPMAHHDHELGILEEDIQSGATLTILDSCIGSMVVSICRDFLESDVTGIPAARLLTTVAPNVVFVPSMGKENTNKAHKRRAMEFYQNFSTRTLVAAQPPDLNATTDRPCGIVFFGREKNGKEAKRLSPTSEEGQPGILVEFNGEDTKVLRPAQPG